MFLATDDLLITRLKPKLTLKMKLAFRTTDFALFLFILNMFTVIQASISRTQSSFANFPKSAEQAGIQKKVNVMVFHNITRGWIVNRNKIGPRTLPWGTPL